MLRESMNMQLPRMMMRRAVKAGLADDWSELMRSEELNPWMIVKMRETYHQARQQDESTVQKVLQRSTDFEQKVHRAELRPWASGRLIAERKGPLEQQAQAGHVTTESDAGARDKVGRVGEAASGVDKVPPTSADAFEIIHYEDHKDWYTFHHRTAGPGENVEEFGQFNLDLHTICERNVEMTKTLAAQLMKV